MMAPELLDEWLHCHHLGERADCDHDVDGRHLRVVGDLGDDEAVAVHPGLHLALLNERRDVGRRVCAAANLQRLLQASLEFVRAEFCHRSPPWK
ncbi:MAG: hypothetical protein ACK55Z_02030 [bacterium]